LLAEPLARLGADVTGVDAAPENIAAAKLHAEGQGLLIDYRAGELAATVAEGLGHVPKGLHDWNRFITPGELETLLAANGLTVIDRRGLSFSPMRGFGLSDNLSIDYFLTAIASQE